MIARLVALAAVFAGVFGVQGAMAAEPKNWQLGLQEAVTPTMERIDSFHDFVTIIATVIALFVMVLLLIVIFRFNEKSNPTPTKTTHNLVLEIAWTVIPILILVVMAIPSFRLMYFADRVDNPDMTLKIIGRQWYWTYEYPDHGDFTFDANIVSEEDLAKDPSLKRNMDTDERVVLPVGKKIQLLMTASDVLHNWAVPAFGIKLDTVPGRLNETWVQINKPGVYYGFCSELCGVNHAYMPITVEAVSPEAFEKWVKQAQKKYAKVDGTPPSVDVAKNAD
ncbi:MAG: cytochrome c oxidase subunit II [Rhodospirillaceae bacterium]|nr:cytochrome c oxidase subunit II [Rhodospirillaceae bacterium]